MRRLLLALALAVPVFGQCGQDITKGPITMYCIPVDMVELSQRLSLPLLPGPRIQFQVFVKTTDPTTEAFAITITYTNPKDGRLVSATQITERSHMQGNPSSGVMFGLDNADVSSIMVRELKTTEPPQEFRKD